MDKLKGYSFQNIIKIFYIVMNIKTQCVLKNSTMRNAPELVFGVSPKLVFRAILLAEIVFFA